MALYVAGHVLLMIEFLEEIMKVIVEGRAVDVVYMDFS